jgi:hypothetical protein
MGNRNLQNIGLPQHFALVANGIRDLLCDVVHSLPISATPSLEVRCFDLPFVLPEIHSRRRLMSFYRMATVLALLTSVALAQRPESKILPSEALHELIKLRLGGGGANGQAAADGILQRTTTADLSANEEVALAFTYFLAFKPKEADALATKHLDRTDLAGRLSWQMHGRMLFRAFQQNAAGRETIPEFRRRFRVSDDDLVHSAWLAYDSAQTFAEEGAYDRAAKELLDDINAVPIDRPFRSFDALGELYEIFQKAGKQKIALALMHKHRDALRAWLAKSGYKGKEEPLTNDTSASHVPTVFHFNPFPGGLNEDRAGFKRGELLQRVAANQIEKFGRWIAAAEAGEKLPAK